MVLASSVLGSKMPGSATAGDIIAILRGDKDAPAWLVKLARSIMVHQDEPKVIELVTSFALEALEKKGIESQKVLDTVKSYSSAINVEMKEATLPDLSSALFNVSERIIDRADDGVINYTAVSVCNSCGHTQLI